MKQFKVGLQTYSIRNDMDRNMYDALKKVREIGYDCIELAGYFLGKEKEVRAMLDEIGLECISLHQTTDVFMTDAQRHIDYLKTLGVKYCAVPWMGIEQHAGHGHFEQTIQEYTKVGKLLADNDIKLLYHNHDFEFEKYEGKYLLDWLYEFVADEYLQTEIDTCWVKYAGEDPAAYIKKYARRSPIVHLKDFICKTTDFDNALTQKENGFEFRPLGHGLQNFSSILAAAKEADTEYVIVEQDEWPTMSAIDSAAESRKYLKTLGI